MAPDAGESGFQIADTFNDFKFHLNLLMFFAKQQFSEKYAKLGRYRL